jgi:hypothetical protein
MKYLFSDGIVAKLRKIPAGVWVIFVILSFFFADAYGLLLSGEYYAATAKASYAQYDVSVNETTLGIFFALAEAALYALFFEIICNISYNLAVGRFRVALNRADFRFRLRYLLVIANTIIGILSIGYFFTQSINGVYTGKITLFGDVINMIAAENPYYEIQNAVMPFFVMSVAIGLFYEDFRVRFVPKRNQEKIFAYFAKFYIGIYLALLVLDVVYNFLLLTNVQHDTVEVISYCVNLAVKVGIAVWAYVNDRRLAKISNEPDDEIKTDDDHHDKNIYSDFGF